MKRRPEPQDDIDLNQKLEYFIESDEADAEGDEVVQGVFIPMSVKGYVYAAKSFNLVKIGVTDCVKSRMKGLANGGAASVTLLFSQMFSDYSIAAKVEKKMHEKFSTRRHHGEWFSLTEEDIELLRQALAAYPTGQ
jgi:hypothetical protein